MLKRPCVPGGEVFPRDGLVRRSIEQKADLVRTPLRPRRYEIRRTAVEEIELRRLCRSGKRARAVQGPVEDVRFGAQDLHRVDLSTPGPRRRLCCRPRFRDSRKRGPAPSPRDLNPCLHQAVRELELVQASGVSPTCSCVRLRRVHGSVLLGGNRQIALSVEAGVAGSRRVVLQLFVAPAVAAHVEVPLRRVGCGAFGPGELVCPDQWRTARARRSLGLGCACAAAEPSSTARR